jgi:thiol-disulfide isomerase/thioredoxin
MVPALIGLGTVVGTLAVLLASSGGAAPPATPAPLSALKPRPLPAETFSARVVAAHRGRVLVVNFWATWCEPCREEMPGLLRAARRLAGEGADLELISVDSPKKADTDVPQFLRELKSHLGSWLLAGDDPQKIIDAVDAKWDGALPYTLIYDRKGRLFRRLKGEQSEREVLKAARAALAVP